MADKLKVLGYVAYLFIMCSTGAHVAGLLTDFWFQGTADTKGAGVQEVNIGLWQYNVRFSNDTEMKTETNQLRREVQYIVLAVAGMNALMCFALLFKNIHVCVGVIAFILISLLVICALLTFVGISSQRERLQEVNSTWPHLRLSWSFYLVFIGLLVHIVSTLVFLACLLVRGEMKAENTKLDLFKGRGGGANDKTPIVSTVSTSESNYDNYAYKNDNAHASYSGSAFAGYASPSSDIDTVDLDNVDYSRNSSAQPIVIRNKTSIQQSHKNDDDFNDISVIESSRL